MEEISIGAQEILTRHRVELHKSFDLVKSLAPRTGIKADTGQENYEKRLRQRLVDELMTHAERGKFAHRYHRERLEQHATPERIAALIEEAKQDADSQEHQDKQKQLEEKHGVAAIQERLGAVENHLVGSGDGRFGQPQADQDQPTDVNAPGTGAGVALLLRHYRGRPLGIEAKRIQKSENKSENDENRASDPDQYAITTPDPDVAGGARVVIFTGSGIRAMSSHPEPHSALAHMVAAGFTDPAPGSYAECSASPDWDWLHTWAKSVSSGDDGELDQFHRERPHPASRAARINDESDPVQRHSSQLDQAVGPIPNNTGTGMENTDVQQGMEQDLATTNAE